VSRKVVNHYCSITYESSGISGNIGFNEILKEPKSLNAYHCPVDRLKFSLVKILSQAFEQQNMKRVKLPGSMSLAEYVKSERKKRGLTAVDLERNSGGEISDSYVSRIESGQVTNVSPEKLDALAKGLGVPADDIYRIARGLPPFDPNDKFEILAEAFDGRDLSKSDWLEIELVLRTLIEHKKNKQESEDPEP
jgi:transcriptional regulator with XRE-family HTH domain